ncbi:MAG: VWA domain-containing protein [Candidatus Eisenbacteria bacterium]|nr:VWA domain-containing protein [Candidatus Eisenbacteria bacterium]
MRFGEPFFLQALLAVPLLWWIFRIGRRRRESLRARFGDPGLLRHLIRGADEGRRRKKERLVLLGFVFLLLALAHPQYGERERMVERRGIDLVFALDTSLSMLAEDPPPSRLDRARGEIEGLLGRLRGDRVGIVSFAGSAVPTCPLTSDYGAVRIFLGGVDAWTAPTAGTSVAAAIRRSLRMLEESPSGSKAIVLLTDGEDHEGEVMEAAEEAAEAGVAVFPIGFGGTEGELIPLPEGSAEGERFKRDQEGGLVVTKRDDEVLGAVARITGGAVYSLRDDPDALELVLDRLSGLERRSYRSGVRTIREERYLWFLVPATILFLIEFGLSTSSGRKREVWSGRIE